MLTYRCRAVAVKHRHLDVHEYQMEWLTSFACRTLSCTQSLLSISVSLAFQSQLLYEADSNLLVELVIFGDADIDIISWNMSATLHLG